MNSVIDKISRAARAVARSLSSNKAGQGMVEYALIIAFVSVLVMIALIYLGPHINSTLNTISNSLNNPAG